MVSTSFQPPATIHPPIQYPAPHPGPPFVDKDSDQYLWLYINNRKAYIESIEPRLLDWENCRNAALLYPQPRKHGVIVFQFVPIEYHSEQVKRWKREVMTRYEVG